MEQPKKEKKHVTRVVARRLECPAELVSNTFDWSVTPWKSDKEFLHEFERDLSSFLHKFKTLSEPARVDVIKFNLYFVFHDSFGEGEHCAKMRGYKVKNIIKEVCTTEYFYSKENVELLTKMYMILWGLEDTQKDLKNVDAVGLKKFIEAETDRFLLPVKVKRYEEIPAFLKAFKLQYPDKFRKLLYKFISGGRVLSYDEWDFSKLLYNLAIDEKSSIEAIGFVVMVIILEKRKELLRNFSPARPKTNGAKKPDKWVNSDNAVLVSFKHCGGRFFIREFVKGKAEGYRSRDTFSFGIQVNPTTASTPTDIYGDYQEHALRHLDIPAKLDAFIPSEELSENGPHSMALIRTECGTKIHDPKITLFKESPQTFFSRDPEGFKSNVKQKLREAKVPANLSLEILNKVLFKL